MPQKAALALWVDAGNKTSYPGTGSLWKDMSGKANHMTLTNMIWSKGEQAGMGWWADCWLLLLPDPVPGRMRSCPHLSS